MEKGFRHPEIPFSQAAAGKHPGFARLLKAPKSYAHTARYFDITRQAVKAWVSRQWVPVKHWPALERLCVDHDLTECIADFVQWGLESGLQPIESKIRDWTESEVRQSVKVLRRFAAKLRVPKCDIEDVAHQALWQMIEYGVRDVNYGMSSLINRLRDKQYDHLVFLGEDEHAVVERLSPHTPSPEYLTIEREHLLAAIAASSVLPAYLKRVFDCLLDECELEEIAERTGVSVRSASSSRALVRRLIMRALEDAA